MFDIEKSHFENSHRKVLKVIFFKIYGDYGIQFELFENYSFETY
jgi:hypothetical protein